MSDPGSGGAGGRRAAAPGGVLPYVPAPALRVAVAAAPLLAFVPVLYYSLATPFALIDDYTDWRYVRLFDSPGAFLQWCRWNFLEPGIFRYRPFWEFYNAVAWKVFGAEPWLHHLSRWVFHFGAVLLFAAAFLRISGREADERPFPGRAAAGGVRPLLPLALLVHLWIFFPNVPAARLGPQEVYSVFFLGLCNYAFALMLAAGAARTPPAGRSPRLAYGLFLTAGLGLSLSKEPNVAPLLWMSIAYWGLLATEPASWSSRAARGAPLALVSFFTLHRVHAASSSHPYGSIPDAGRLADNLGLILRELFLRDTSFVLTGVFVLLSAALLLAVAARLAAFGRLSRTARGELLFVLFLLGQFFSTYFMVAGQPVVAPRYWYVLVPCFTTLLAFGARYALAFLAPCPRRSLAAARALAAFVLFFILVNYHNFLFQTTVQHSLRRTEADLIATVNRLLDGDQRVQILKKKSPAVPGLEVVNSFEQQYREFQPRFHGRKRLKTYAGADPLHADSPRLESDQPRWVVSVYGDTGLGPRPPYTARSGGFRVVDLYGDSRFVNAGMVTMVPKNDYRLLSWAGTVSRFLQRGGPRVVSDFGVHTPDDRQLYGWVVWHAPYDPGDWMAGTLSRIVARAGEPVVRSHWDVHVEESARLAYLVKDACEPADVEADFFVEILETDEAEHGFHHLAFSFGYWGVAAGGRCVAAVAFPNGVEGMTVGQYGVWSEVVAFRRAPAAARLTAP